MAVGPSAPPIIPTEDDFSSAEAHETAANESHEDAQLRGSTQQQALGVGDQGAEVGHSAHAHEDETGIDAQLDAQIQHINETHGNGDVAQGHTAGGSKLLCTGQGLNLYSDGVCHIAAGGSDLGGGLVQSVCIKQTLGGGPQGIHIRLQHIGGNTGAKHLGQEACRDGFTLENIPVDMTAGKEDLVEHAGARQIGHQHANGDGYQQQRLKLLLNAQK